MERVRPNMIPSNAQITPDGFYKNSYDDLKQDHKFINGFYSTDSIKFS